MPGLCSYKFLLKSKPSKILHLTFVRTYVMAAVTSRLYILLHHNLDCGNGGGRAGGISPAPTCALLRHNDGNGGGGIKNKFDLVCKVEGFGWKTLTEQVLGLAR